MGGREGGRIVKLCGWYDMGWARLAVVVVGGGRQEVKSLRLIGCNWVGRRWPRLRLSGRNSACMKRTRGEVGTETQRQTHREAATDSVQERQSVKMNDAMRKA